MARHIHNLHCRVLPAAPEKVWDVLTLLGTDEDPIYPHELGWVRFPQGLYSGAPMVQHNGAQLIEYHVKECVPGRRLWFGEMPGIGIEHGFVLEPVEGGTRISHALEGGVPAVLKLLWNAVLHIHHDNTSEGMLDNLERIVTGRLDRSHRESLPAAAFRLLLGRRAARVAPPRMQTAPADRIPPLPREI